MTDKEVRAWVEKIGLRVRELRNQRKKAKGEDPERWNQTEFGKAVGLSRETISNLERGAVAVGIDALIRALYGLNLDLWTIFGGDPERRPQYPPELDNIHKMVDVIYANGSTENKQTILSVVRGIYKDVNR